VSLYFDNAATSFPKPDVVHAAADSAMRECGASAGRGVYAAASEATRLVGEARLRVASLLGVREPNRVIFGFNGTDALNMAIHGIMKPGEQVVTTDLEHNSVLRPLRTVADRHGVVIHRVSPRRDGIVPPGEIAAAITSATRLVVVTHASNVTGVIQPVEEIAAVARRHGCRVLVDAAQSAGHVPIDVDGNRFDLVATSGHKGLLGPLGTGLLALGTNVADEMQTVREGGTGTSSDDDRQPTTLPDRFEPGNYNVPGLAGLGAAVKWIEEQGMASIRQHEIECTQALLRGLQSIAGITLHCADCAVPRVGVVSLTLTSGALPPQEFATILDQQFGIAVRAGLHCSPRAHLAIGTAATGGTVRLSTGPFTTEVEIRAVCDAIREIAAAV
jgi:cysteine desulfurase family protein